MVLYTLNRKGELEQYTVNCDKAKEEFYNNYNQIYTELDNSLYVDSVYDKSSESISKNTIHNASDVMNTLENLMNQSVMDLKVLYYLFSSDVRMNNPTVVLKVRSIFNLFDYQLEMTLSREILLGMIRYGFPPLQDQSCCYNTWVFDKLGNPQRIEPPKKFCLLNSSKK